MIDYAEKGHTLAVGFPLADVAVPTATVGTVYEMAQLSSTASALELSNEVQYPYFSRLVTSPVQYPYAMKDIILHYYSIMGIGWNNVAVISDLSAFVKNIATSFVAIAEPELNIVSFQQYLLEQQLANDLEVEFHELQRSGARVFVGLIFGDWPGFITIADSYGLVGENYVWLTSPGVTNIPFDNPTPLAQGTVGTVFATRLPDDEIAQNFAAMFKNLDPNEYPGFDYPMGGGFAFVGYDMAMTAALAIDKMEKQGKLNSTISPDEWNEAIRSVQFNGASNYVSFKSNGDRKGATNFFYYSYETNEWKFSGNWTEENGFTVYNDVVWYSNTTEIPDLDIRKPLHYWSCDDKKMKFDKTGKSIELQTPDNSDDIKYIDSSYHCDNFIDCKNLSDESVDCSSNYLIVFIVFGILTGILILCCIILIAFVIIFGVLLEYRRLRSASPFFLILMLISTIIGYSSIYAWFGKPNKIACGFQPWLLGLSVISLITALSVKNFRIWKIFRFPSKKLRISNFELFIFWSLIMIPAVIILILWTAISTPTATMEERDGTDHYVCTTGGVTGKPGGLIFFFILVAYTSIVLLFGAVISILTRNVPSQFNETKLMTISIYNLGFLAAVIIPVYMVVEPFNPFVSWILRTCAVLYAFTATLIIQFLPIIFGIFILDKGRNVKVFKSKLKLNASENSTTSDTIRSQQ